MVSVPGDVWSTAVSFTHGSRDFRTGTHCWNPVQAESGRAAAQALPAASQYHDVTMLLSALPIFRMLTFPSIPQAFQVDKPHLKNIPEEQNKKPRQCRAVSALTTAPRGQKWFCWTLTRLVQLGSGILIKFVLELCSVDSEEELSLVPLMWSCAVWALLATRTRVTPQDVCACTMTPLVLDLGLVAEAGRP